MSLQLSAVSKMLGVTEATVRRWLRQGKIPAREVRGQIIFNKRQIQRWIDTHRLSVTAEGPPDHAPVDIKTIRVNDVLQRGGIYYDVPGNDIRLVLESAVNLCPLPDTVSREHVLMQLLQREQLTSTGIGNGIAIPHPRKPLEHISDPIIATFFLRDAIDFHAIDKKPVFVLFMLLSPNSRIHVHLLSQLSFCLSDQSLTGLLKNRPSADSLCQQMADKLDAEP